MSCTQENCQVFGQALTMEEIMAEGQNLIYKCELCGAMVEVLALGADDLTCCNEAMVLVEAGSVDASKEKSMFR
jgi:desulfoferrodoxin-like iron-binding protein